MVNQDRIVFRGTAFRVQKSGFHAGRKVIRILQGERTRHHGWFITVRIQIHIQQCAKITEEICLRGKAFRAYKAFRASRSGFRRAYWKHSTEIKKCSLLSLMLFPHAIHCLVATFSFTVDHVSRRLLVQLRPCKTPAPVLPVYDARPPLTIFAMFPLPLLEKMLIIPKPT